MSLISETLPPELIRRKPDLVTQNTRPDLKKKAKLHYYLRPKFNFISLQFAVGKLKKWHEIHIIGSNSLLYGSNVESWSRLSNSFVDYSTLNRMYAYLKN